ncbi:MAG: TonB-dependent receptor, partial [Phaeodactylibacter sp.]|nr:TonB-dependent receptor [Phaeodactylibacter sp.]
MLGALGIEAAAEGPFAKGQRASYLVNFRYSTLAALKAVGLNPVGDILPEYQDLSFKVNLPTEKAGTFSLFGLGGMNRAYFSPEPDSTVWQNSDSNEWGFEEKQIVGTVGLSHRILLSEQSYLRTVLAASNNRYDAEYYYLEPENNYAKVLDEFSTFKTQTYRLSSTYNHKFNARHTLRAGVIVSRYDFNYDLQIWDEELEAFETFFENKGQTELYQAFAQWKYRFNDDWTLNSGLHYTLFGLNNNYSIEPRMALSWQMTSKQSLSASVGLHSKPEQIAFYFAEVTQPGQPRTAPNKDLELMKSMHAVLGYDLRFSEQMRLKVETYYQHLYDVPTEATPGSPYSIINSSDIWDILRADAASNEGTGRNYGLDLTLERFFADQYYFLITGTLFDSKYTPKNGVEYNTRFNSNYQLSVLAGKEFNVGKKGNKIFGVNLKSLWVGGNRYTPIDIEASKAMGYTVRYEDRQFEAKAPDYWRLDLGLSYKINTQRMTHTILVDIQNLTNRENAYTLYYSPVTEKIESYTQTGFFPNFNYRIEF